MHHRLDCLVLFALASVTACQSAPPEPSASSSSSAYLYDDLGTYHRKVTTTSPEAQRFVDQGLVLAFAFNHTEAERSFREAARLDPTCAMAWWGVALVNGPHINNATVDAARAVRAWEAIVKARMLAEGASALERELIEAQAQRYAAVAPEDRRALDEAYARAMRDLARKYRKDADVLALCAEALMDLQPWDLWTRDGKPKGNTDEIVELLEAAIAVAPDHPLANHLYVHALEASLHPEKALAAADRLRNLVPDAGHLVHMPAHIDLRLGHYADASAANVRAMAADAKHRDRIPKDGFYRVYMAHNPHFLAFSSMMEGRSDAALSAARALIDGVPPEFIANSPAFIDGFMPIALHVYTRFGRWDEILREPPFPDDLTVSNALRHYARGVAFTALGRIDEAEAEASAFALAVEKIDAARTVGNNPASKVVEIARDVLAGEIAFRRGRTDEAIDLLRRAAANEDLLVYDEPPDWMMPVRHTLGAVLVEAERFDDAQAVYLADLKRFPENGWSLYGLSRCLERRGATADSRAVKERLSKAWKGADVQITSSCFCLPGM